MAISCYCPKGHQNSLIGGVKPIYCGKCACKMSAPISTASKPITQPTQKHNPFSFVESEEDHIIDYRDPEEDNIHDIAGNMRGLAADLIIEDNREKDKGMSLEDAVFKYSRPAEASSPAKRKRISKAEAKNKFDNLMSQVNSSRFSKQVGENE